MTVVQDMNFRSSTSIQNNAGVFPDGLFEIFRRLNLSSRSMALGSTQPLNRNKYKESPMGLWQLMRRADNLTTFICSLNILGAPNSWSTRGLVRPLHGYLYFYSKPRGNLDLHAKCPYLFSDCKYYSRLWRKYVSSVKYKLKGKSVRSETRYSLQKEFFSTSKLPLIINRFQPDLHILYEYV